MSIKSKKEQFTREEKKGSPLVFVVVVMAVIAVVAFFLITRDAAPADNTPGYFGEPVAQERSYLNRLISMTEIDPEISSEWITFPLELVEENNILYFEADNDEGFTVPLMAYITPSGRLFTGSSMCEPCGGRTFSLAGETLVCDLCRTTYTIEDHKFISGSPACGSYPPLYMSPVVEDGMIKIPLREVLEWRIRAY